MGKLARIHRDLDVYRRAFDAAMELFEMTRTLPAEERYSLMDQVRRSFRSICTNLAEAWRKRRYEGAFVSKLSDAESEAAETQVWLEFAVKCRDFSAEPTRALYRTYDGILRSIVGMMTHPKTWCLPTSTRK